MIFIAFLLVLTTQFFCASNRLLGLYCEQNDLLHSLEYQSDGSMVIAAVHYGNYFSKYNLVMSKLNQ